MKNKFLSVVICFLIISMPVFWCTSVSAGSPLHKAQNLMNDIVDYNLKESGTGSCQSWINDTLAENAGTTSEWYIFGLSQSGSYDFSVYQKALKNYLENNEVYSAVSRQKYAIVLIATGSSDSYIEQVLNNTIGQQGIMSWVYGLHLLNNGYKSKDYTVSQVKDKIISLQLSDGGWAVMGKTSEIDVTAMVIQAMAPYYQTDAKVKTAVDRAITLLSKRQLNDGDYSNYGVDNLESTAQVLTALSCVGIDGENDSRFIKNGNSLLDGIEKYQLPDGAFCHKLDGGFSETATTQAYYTLTAYVRMIQGKSGLYILDNRNPDAFTAQSVIQATDNTAVTDKNSATDKNPVENKTDTSKTKEPTDTTATENTAAVQDKTEATEKATEKSKKDKTPAQSVPVVTETTELKKPNTVAQTVQIADKDNDSVNYKLIACFVIVGMGGVACMVFFLLKKRNKKNFLVIAGAVLIMVAFVLMTDFRSTKDYYNGKKYKKDNPIGNVTMTIRCDTIVGKSDSKYIPQNGIILDTTEFEIEENTSVYNNLTEAAQTYKIQVDNSGTEKMAYISGINYLYEFDFGHRSGWVYRVNGETPSVGCGEYILSDGDQIEWLYSCELGKDLE